MPFTLAHPAAIIPFKRWPLMSTVPLIIGSLTPDLVIYLPLRLATQRGLLPPSHSPLGTLVLDLPLGLLLLWLLVWLRTPLTAPLWQPHRRFVREAIHHTMVMRWWWLASIPSLVLGSWTHILWDSFTHQNRFMVRQLPFLEMQLFPGSAHPMALYHALQYGCSVAGLIFLAWWYFAQLRRSGLKGTGRWWRKYLLAGMVLAAVGTGFLHLILIPFPVDRMPFYFRAAIVAGTAIPAFGCCYLLTGLLLTRLRPDAFLPDSKESP